MCANISAATCQAHRRPLAQAPTLSSTTHHQPYHPPAANTRACTRGRSPGYTSISSERLAPYASLLHVVLCTQWLASAPSVDHTRMLRGPLRTAWAKKQHWRQNQSFHKTGSSTGEKRPSRSICCSHTLCREGRASHPWAMHPVRSAWAMKWAATSSAHARRLRADDLTKTKRHKLFTARKDRI